MSASLHSLALRHLGSSLLISLSMLLLGAGLFRLAQHRLAQTQADTARARAEAQTHRERYLAISRDEAQIRQTLAQFHALAQQGLIGPESRLEWANQLRTAARERRLENLEFSIAPQRSLGKIDPEGLFQLNASQMQLSLTLLHEGEILRLLNDLERQPDAMPLPQRCRLQRTAPQATGSERSLRAECALDWITITPTTHRPETLSSNQP